MLNDLSSMVHRQARRICTGAPQFVEDAYQEGRIKLWTLLERGHRDHGYLLAATRNCMIDFMRHEMCEPGTLEAHGDPDAFDADPWENNPGPDYGLAEIHVLDFIGHQDDAVRDALLKQVTGEGGPLTGAERTALSRAREDLQAQWLSDPSAPQAA